MSHKLLALVLTLALAVVAAPLLAQAPAGGMMVPPEIADALAKEKPLTQADIDIYLKKMPEAPNYTQSPDALADFAKSTGLSESRYFFVFTKIPLALARAAGMPAEAMGIDQLPAVLHPTEADIALVKKNSEALQKVMMDLAAAMEKQSAEAATKKK